MMSKRGRIETIFLKKPIVINDLLIMKAIIEIDHINFGLNKKTGELNKKRRSNFTVREIELFIHALNDEDIVLIRKRKFKKVYMVKIDCPIRRLHFGRLFIMIFELNLLKPMTMLTITIYPGWSK